MEKGKAPSQTLPHPLLSLKLQLSATKDSRHQYLVVDEVKIK